MRDARQTDAPPGGLDQAVRNVAPLSSPTKAVSSAGSAASTAYTTTDGQPGQEGGAFDAGAWRRDYEAVCNKLPKEYNGAAAKLKSQGAATLKDAVKAGPDHPLPLLTAHHILTTDWPPPIWAIPGLLPTGLAILAGRPKLGKSWLALQIALAVATGGHVLGQKVEPGPVLFLALEDSPVRLKDRMQKQDWPSNAQADFMVMRQFADEVGSLTGGGGWEKLARMIGSKGYRLVVVDTLSKALMGDQDDVAAMTTALSPLQATALEHNCVIMLIDHHNKLGALTPDVVANILGSTAKGANPDTIWGLYRERGKREAQLAVTGRDVEDQTLALTMAWDLGCWQCEGNADGIAMTGRRQEIVDTLRGLGKAKLQQVADAIAQDKGNTYRRLQDLVSAGKVKRDGDWYTAI
jgi:hypothetical protein